MIKIFICALILILSTGCKTSSSDTDSDLGSLNTCTLMGSFYSLKVHIISLNPLPQNLSFSLNDKSISASECVSSDGFKIGDITFNSNRTEAVVDFLLADGNFEYYFANINNSPSSNIFKLNIYNSTNCSENPTLFSQVLDGQIQWQPIYANGEKCGVTSYMGSGSVQIN